MPTSQLKRVPTTWPGAPRPPPDRIAPEPPDAKAHVCCALTPVHPLHGKVVRHQEPVKSYLTAYHIPNDFGAGGRRTLWINRLIDDVRGHGDGALVKTAKSHKVAGR